MYLPAKYFTLPGCHMLVKHWNFLKWGGGKRQLGDAHLLQNVNILWGGRFGDSTTAVWGVWGLL